MRYSTDSGQSFKLRCYSAFRNSRHSCGMQLFLSLKQNATEEQKHIFKNFILSFYSVYGFYHNGSHSYKQVSIYRIVLIVTKTVVLWKKKQVSSSNSKCVLLSGLLWFRLVLWVTFWRVQNCILPKWAVSAQVLMAHWRIVRFIALRHAGALWTALITIINSCVIWLCLIYDIETPVLGWRAETPN